MNALTRTGDFDLDEDMAAERLEPHQSLQEQAETLRQLGTFHLAHGAVRTADHLSALAIWLAPEDAVAMRLRAHVLARKGDPVAGLKMLLSAAKASPGAIKIGDWMALGLAFARQRDIGYARKLLLRKQRPAPPRA